MALLLTVAVMTPTLGFVGTVDAVTNPSITECTTIDEAGYYVLGENVTADGDGACIEITTSDVVFNGAGYTVDGASGRSYGKGIYVDGNGLSGLTYPPEITNITVYNVEVVDWANGIESLNAQVTIRDVYATGNRANAIGVRGGTGSIVSNNTLEANDDGIDVAGAEATIVRDNVIRDGEGAGIRLFRSTETVLRRNTITDSAERSFGIEGEAPAHFRHDIDTSNLVDGIPIQYYRNETGLTVDSASGVGYLGIVDSSNVVVRDFIKSGQGQGVLLANVEDATLENVDAYDNMQGIVLYGTTNVTVRESAATSNAVSGVVVIDAVETTLEAIQVTGTTAGLGSYEVNAIEIEDANATTVRNSSISGNNGAALDIRGNGVHLLGNTITDNNGISVWSDRDVLIANNDMSAVGSSCIEVNSAVNVSITGNVLENCDDDGIDVNTGAETTITSNVIDTVEEAGILVDTPGALVENNTVRNADYDSESRGIEVAYGEESRFLNNVITDSSVGVWLADTQGNVFENTTVHGIDEWAFYAEESSNTTADGFDLGDGYNLTFTAENVGFATESTPPADPTGSQNVSRFLRVVASEDGAWFEVTVPYTEADAAAANVTESTLRLWQHNGTVWSELSGSTVDEGTNVVSGNLTGLLEYDARVVAPLTTTVSGGSSGSETDSSAPISTVDATSIEFGGVAIGSTSSQTVTITNDGNATLSVSDTTLSGPNASAFSVDNGGSFTLAPAATRTLTVTYEPTTNSSHAATLTVSSNATDEAVSLSGIGLANTSNDSDGNDGTDGGSTLDATVVDPVPTMLPVGENVTATYNVSNVASAEYTLSSPGSSIDLDTVSVWMEGELVSRTGSATYQVPITDSTFNVTIRTTDETVGELWIKPTFGAEPDNGTVSYYVPNTVKLDVYPTPIVVPRDYPTLQAAIDAAPAGWTVAADGDEGPFSENLQIAKDLTLTRVENRSFLPTIEPSPTAASSDPLVLIGNGANVTVDGLFFAIDEQGIIVIGSGTQATIHDNTFWQGEYAVAAGPDGLFSGSPPAALTVTDNSFEFTDTGVEVVGVDDVTVTGNYLLGADVGVSASLIVDPLGSLSSETSTDSTSSDSEYSGSFDSGRIDDPLIGGGVLEPTIEFGPLVTIADNTFSETVTGVSLSNIDAPQSDFRSEAVVVRENTFEYTGNYSTEFYEEDDSAIQISQAEFVAVRDNEFTDAKSIGIEFLDDSAGNVTNNSIEVTDSVTFTGFSSGSLARGVAYEASTGTVADNDIDALTGILLAEANGSAAVNNTVSNSNIGVEVRDSVDVTVRENDVIGGTVGVSFGVGSVGLLGVYDDTSTGIVANNSLITAGTGILTGSNSRVDIANNVILAPSAVHVESGNATVRSNDLRGNVGVFVGDASDPAPFARANVSVIGNDIDTTTGVHVLEFASLNTTVRYNDLRGTDLAATADTSPITGLFSFQFVDVRYNYFGPRGPNGPANARTEGNVSSLEPFATKPPSEFDTTIALDRFQAFGYDYSLEAGEAYALGTPTRLEHNLSVTLGDFEGVVYLFDETTQTWSLATGDETLGSMDVAVIIPKSDARAVIDIADGVVTQPTDRQLVAGWNLVAPRQHGGAEHGFSSTNVGGTDLLKLYAQPGELGWNIGTEFTHYGFGDSGEPTVTPYTGYWIYVTADGSLPGIVPIGVSAAEYEQLLEESE